MTVQDKAKEFRTAIETITSTATDENALTAQVLYPEWVDSKHYDVGCRYRRGNSLYKCIQSHDGQADWMPECTPSLWTEICESHSGTELDPIPYNGNMALENGKYYSQDNVVYLCIRDTVNPVYNTLNDLIDLYVEVTS